jgi:hypothetical protein
VDTFRQAIDTPEKVMIIPYTQYEVEYCARHRLQLRQSVINVIGRHEQVYRCEQHVMQKCFRPLDTSMQSLPDADTIFVPDYANNKRLIALFTKHGISIATGRYTGTSELTKYRAVVSLPDAICKIGYFEAIQHGVVTLLPSLPFLQELVKNVDYAFTSKQHMTADTLVLCDQYRYDDCYVFFDSFDDLTRILTSDDFSEQASRAKCAMTKRRDDIHDATMSAWKDVLHRFL